MPGQFVALAVGGPGSAMLLRRSFAIHTADPVSGLVGLVVAAHGPGTVWLSAVEAGAELDVVGPLGRPFTPPGPGQSVVLVGGGYGGAPLFDLARAVRAGGGTAHLVLGAATADRLFGVAEGHEAADTVVVTTDDGSAGERGLVTAAVVPLLAQADRVVACGPMGMLRAVGDLAASTGVPCEVAVEESMACGIGVCMTCVLPVVGSDGRTRMTRSCTEGPVFDATTVRWADVGRLPGDVFGADAMAGH
ncbi:MAG: dihydroorotate dehydrogenase electron transfer subunit [Geodermatophilaceae bacterium]|nr:dihydroorotate dehydrogenase electron transfer subunit [Geodermatophilaceae bacterium]